MLHDIVKAARWAPTGGNNRVHHLVCITDKSLIKKVQLFFPGMVAGLPPALIFVGIGFPAEPPANMPRWPKKKFTVEDLVQWGSYPAGHS